MLVPAEVSGRPVTGRGVHLHPTGFHGFWLERADYWVALLQSMGMSWALVLSDSDGAVAPHASVGGRSAVQVLLDGGMIPVVRFLPSNLPRDFEQMAHVETLVAQCEPYGVQPIVQWPNEPGDPREWTKGETPDDWWPKFLDRWMGFARIVVERGAVAGFPDGPCYEEDPFPFIESTWDLWEDGQAIYLGHHYALNRPLAYPYDNIQRYGLPWTEEDLQDALGDFYDDPGYNDVPLAVMNRARWEQKDPDLTAVEDDTCWRGWERVQSWMELHFGKTLLMALTEGGQTPGARAGGGVTAEVRYPKPTPENVADFTVGMFEAETPMVFQTPWLLADGDMAGGDQGWPYDAWHGWAFSELYGTSKPVIRALQATAPGGETAVELIEGAQVSMDDALLALECAVDALGGE